MERVDVGFGKLGFKKLEITYPVDFLWGDLSGSRWQEEQTGYERNGRLAQEKC